MRFPSVRSRLRPLDERECYLRLHGARSGEVEIVHRPAATPDDAPPAAAGPPAPAPGPTATATAPDAEPPAAPAPGPTDDAPALHLVIAYPRRGGRLTGEQVRRDLLRRMGERTGEAA